MVCAWVSLLATHRQPQHLNTTAHNQTFSSMQGAGGSRRQASGFGVGGPTPGTASRPLPAPAAPPKAWGRYFPQLAYQAGLRQAELVQELMSALSTDAGWQVLSAGLQALPQFGSCVVLLDVQQLSALLQDDASLSAALSLAPAEGLACLQVAVHEVRAREGVPLVRLCGREEQGGHKGQHVLYVLCMLCSSEANAAHK